MINKIESDLNKNKEQLNKMSIVSELLKLQNSVTKSKEANIDKTKEANLQKEFKEIIDQILDDLENKTEKEQELTSLKKQINILKMGNIEEFIDTYKVQAWKKQAEQNIFKTIAEAKNDSNPIARWLWIIMDKIWNA